MYELIVMYVGRTQLYIRIKLGNPLLAYQQTQKDMLTQGDDIQPYDWIGFTYYGV